MQARDSTSLPRALRHMMQRASAEGARDETARLSAHGWYDVRIYGYTHVCICMFAYRYKHMDKHVNKIYIYIYECNVYVHAFPATDIYV